MINLIYYFLLNLFSILVLVGFVLVGVAFLTLFERKILGYVQFRKGPNKLCLEGFFQPFSDAIKLFMKESLVIYKSNYFIYNLCPILFLFLMLFFWFLVPFITNIYYFNYSLLFMIILMSISGFVMLLMGWSSNSIFSLMGAIRFVAQSISYEVSFILIVYCFMLLSESYSISVLTSWQKYIWYMIYLFPVFVVFFISVLAEMNRSPMDLVEGESELVSGFNIEYFGGSFALIFMAEYGMIIFFSFILSLLFTDSYLYSWFFFIVVGLFMAAIILVRGMVPRIRYDELMQLCWKVILPLVLIYLIFLFSLKFMLFLIQ